MLEGKSIVVSMDPYDVRNRIKARAYRVSGTQSTYTFTVPTGKVWVIWAASFMNNTVAAEPTVVVYLEGNPPGPAQGIFFVWPTVSTGSGPPGAGEYGSILDPAWYPQVIRSGNEVTIIDNAWAAGHQTQFFMLYTELAEDEYI